MVILTMNQFLFSGVSVYRQKRKALPNLLFLNNENFITLSYKGKLIYLYIVQYITILPVSKEFHD